MTKRKEIEVKRKRKKLLKEGKAEIERRRAEKRARRKRREFAKNITLREETLPAFNIMEKCDYCGEAKMSWEITIDDSLVAKNICFQCKKRLAIRE